MSEDWTGAAHSPLQTGAIPTGSFRALTPRSRREARERSGQERPPPGFEDEWTIERARRPQFRSGTAPPVPAPGASPISPVAPEPVPGSWAEPGGAPDERRRGGASVGTGTEVEEGQPAARTGGRRPDWADRADRSDWIERPGGSDRPDGIVWPDGDSPDGPIRVDDRGGAGAPPGWAPRGPGREPVREADPSLVPDLRQAPPGPEPSAAPKPQVGAGGGLAGPDVVDRDQLDRGVLDRGRADRQLTERDLAERDLAERDLAERGVVDRDGTGRPGQDRRVEDRGIQARAAQGEESDAEADTAAIMRSSGLMAAGTFVSRVLGQVRSTALGWAIGGLTSASVFQLSNTLPNNFYALLAGGVFNAVLVPQIVKAAKQPDGGQEYVSRLLTMGSAFLLAATLAVTAIAGPLFVLYAGHLPANQVALGTAFAVWCLPQLFFYGLYTLLGQVLNARGSYGPFMWAPAVNNVIAIAGLIAFVVVAGPGNKDPNWWTPATIALLAGTTTLGIVGQALILLPALRKVGFRWRLRWGLRGMGFGAAGKVAGWTFAAVVVGQLAFVKTSQVISQGGNAARAAHLLVQPNWFAYTNGFLLFMLPHSLVTVSLTTAVFTRMSEAALHGRISDVREDLSIGMRTVGVAMVIATAAIVVLGQDLARVAFAGNSPGEATAVALVTIMMGIGLVPFSAQYLYQRVFYAFEDARTPFIIQAVIAATWTLGNVISQLVLPARSWTIGVCVAMSVSSLVGAAISIPLLRKRIGSVDGPRVIRSHIRFVIAAAIAGAAGWGVVRVIHEIVGFGRISSLAVVMLAGVTMLSIYWSLLRMMRVPELDDLARPVADRMAGPPVPAGRHILSRADQRVAE